MSKWFHFIFHHLSQIQTNGSVLQFLTICMSIGGLSGMFTPWVTTRKRRWVRRADTMISSFMRFTALALSRTFGKCTTTSTRSMRSCPTQITCYSRRGLSQSGKTWITEKEASGWWHYQSKTIWRKSAVLPGKRSWRPSFQETSSRMRWSSSTALSFRSERSISE